VTERHSQAQQPEAEREVQEPVVVRDRRKIDPETGELRRQQAAEAAPDADPGLAGEPTGPAVPADAGEPGAEDPAGQVSEVEQQLAERTADLQRLQAEYANYRKRVDRDREVVVAGAKASVVNELLPLLDDLERAEQHGDLTGAFKAVADKLVGGLQRVGLEPFGEEGEPFDPSVHEAVQHNTSPDVDGPTVTTVMRRGYRFGERVLRAALVGVTDHEPGAAEPADAPAQGRHAAPEQPVDAPHEGQLPVDESQQQ
jgi:molecular chaperone GrpE